MTQAIVVEVLTQKQPLARLLLYKMLGLHVDLVFDDTSQSAWPNVAICVIKGGRGETGTTTE
jgi:hypothetical protein